MVHNHTYNLCFISSYFVYFAYVLVRYSSLCILNIKAIEWIFGPGMENIIDLVIRKLFQLLSKYSRPKKIANSRELGVNFLYKFKILYNYN